MLFGELWRVVAVRDRVVDVALVVDERRVPGSTRSRVVALGLIRGVERPELLARLRIERERTPTAGLGGLGQVQDAVPDRRLDREAEVLALRDPGVVLEDLLLPDLLPGLGVEREHVAVGHAEEDPVLVGEAVRPERRRVVLDLPQLLARLQVVRHDVRGEVLHVGDAVLADERRGGESPEGPEPVSGCVQVTFRSSTFSESISEFATRVFS